MSPGLYTELFFLDEAVALAAVYTCADAGGNGSKLCGQLEGVDWQR
jgi:hypothetical protein